MIKLVEKAYKTLLDAHKQTVFLRIARNRLQRKAHKKIPGCKKRIQICESGIKKLEHLVEKLEIELQAFLSSKTH